MRIKKRMILSHYKIMFFSSFWKMTSNHNQCVCFTTQTLKHNLLGAFIKSLLLVCWVNIIFNPNILKLISVWFWKKFDINLVLTF